jgi:D-alanyl-D-alanine carboxypeptidase (penicillin-binding protein 5/6)
MRLKRVHNLVWALFLAVSAFAPGLLHSSAQTQASLPDVTAQAVYVYDATANLELTSLDADVRRAPASTVKIVTAMVVVDHADLDAQVVVDAQDVTDPSSGESTMTLAAGDTLTVEQLLTGLMLPSGNDAARTLARYVGILLLDGASGDPIERFVDEMNAKVREAGLSNSQFTSPDGFSDSDDMYTTAYDLAHLGALAMEYEEIAGIVSLATAEVVSVGPEAHAMSLQNTNKFLPDSGSEYATEGVVGLKSGSTTKAGACLVLAERERGGNLIIAVVLGSQLTYNEETNMIEVDARWDDMQSVLGSVDDTFAWLNPESNNDVPGLKDEMSAWQVSLVDDSALIVPDDQSEAITYRIELKAIGPSKSDAGRVLFFAGSQQIAERPLVFR